jgi:hypothetical protein
MPQVAARIISILGHPLLVLPAALLLPTLLISHGQHTRDASTLSSIAAGFAIFAAMVLGWSWWQVRQGRWAHVDASGHDERRVLNRTLLTMILIGALLAWRSLPEPDLAIALLLAAAIVMAAILSTRICKLSLHFAFAVYAAGLVWPLGKAAMGAGFAFSASVAWSRLRLSRHQPRDLIAGGAIGLLAGTIHWATLAALRG